jgi:hypothetical protein
LWAFARFAFDFWARFLNAAAAFHPFSALTAQANSARFEQNFKNKHTTCRWSSSSSSAQVRSSLQSQC